MQTIYIENKETIQINEIVGIGDYNENEISLYTEDGKIEIKGLNLSVVKYDNESYEFVGKGSVKSILFNEKLPKHTGIIKRLLK